MSTLETLEIAHLVTHRQRPGSFGYVESLDPLKVIWRVGGREAKEWWGLVQRADDPAFSSGSGLNDGYP